MEVTATCLTSLIDIAPCRFLTFFVSSSLFSVSLPPILICYRMPVVPQEGTSRVRRHVQRDLMCIVWLWFYPHIFVLHPSPLHALLLLLWRDVMASLHRAALSLGSATHAAASLAQAVRAGTDRCLALMHLTAVITQSLTTSLHNTALSTL